MQRTPKLLLTAVLAAVCCVAQASGRVRQQPPVQDGESAAREAEQDSARAEELYQQGVALLERGRADESAAVRTFGEALKLYLSLYTQRTLPSPATGAASYRDVMRGRLSHAPECVERYLHLVKGGSEFERSQLEAFRAHALGLVKEDESRMIFLGTETDTRARITDKPEPGFTEEARRNNVEGTVRLRAVLATDGTVKHILVAKGLPHGMSEACVAAAAKMRFTPAVRNGRPVSQFVALEYHFSTH